MSGTQEALPTLAPCPFCGGDRITTLKSTRLGRCLDCGAEAKNWNRRQGSVVRPVGGSSIAILLDLLQDASELLERYEDVTDGYPNPLPNAAMRLKAEIDAEIAKHRK